MFRYLFIVINTFFIITTSFGGEIRLKEDYSIYSQRGTLYPFITNSLGVTALAALGWDDNTPSYFTHAAGTNAFLEVWLEKETGIDAIAFNVGKIQPAEIRIISYPGKGSDEIPVYEDLAAFKQNSGLQIYYLNHRVSAGRWRFELTKQFPGGGIPYLNGLAFMNGGEKMVIANLTEAKRKFNEGFRLDRLNQLKGMFFDLHQAVFSTNAAVINKRWKSSGVNTENIYIKQVENGTALRIKLTGSGDNPYEGTILALIAVKSLTGYVAADITQKESYAEIGRWKLDETGKMWIKVGQGEWKQDSGLGILAGTDLEGITSVSGCK